MSTFENFIREDDGVTAIEYGLIAILIFFVIVGSVTLLGQKVLGLYNSVVGVLP